MPIYEYECTQCGKVHEVWQQMSDQPLKKCKDCSGKVQKLISRSAFHLKGSGWYATDYAGKSACSSPSKSPAGTGSDKGDSKKEAVCCPQKDSAGSKTE